MKKNIITFGLIAGTIVSASMLIAVPFWKNGAINPGNGQFIGYTTMVIALSMVFVGIKNYRDQYNNGVITFGKAVKIGVMISLIAAMMYAITWEIILRFLMPDFMAHMKNFYVEERQRSGGTAAEIATVREQMDQMMSWYKNPFLRFAMTLMEIFPVGLIISLISAALLRKKDVAVVS